MRYINKMGGGGTVWDTFASVKNVGNKDIAASEKLPEFDKAPSEAIEVLRQKLAKQQGYLCAFCLAALDITEDASGTIVRHKTKIAHRTSQAAPKNSNAAEKLRRRMLEVDQHNLVLACMGKNSPLGHCDEKQKSKDVDIPFENELFMQANFSFLQNGLLSTPNAGIRAQIGAEREADDKASTLNLNNPVLCRRRREAIENLANVLQMRGNYSPATLTNALQKYTQPDPETGRMQAYCEWLAHYLRKRLARNQPQRAQPNLPVGGNQKKNLRRR